MASFVVIGLHYSKNGTEGLPKARPGAPKIEVQPKQVRLGEHAAREVQRVAAKFVQTAVLRLHVGRSYDLAAPALREGMTREQWAKGAIPVVPYPPHDLARAVWNLSYSYRNQVGLLVGFFPKPHAKTPYEAFTIELTALGKGAHRRWLVDSWIPAGYGIGQAAPTGTRQLPPARAPLSKVWIFVPVGILFGLIILIPIVLGLRGWLRYRRVSAYAGGSSRTLPPLKR